MTVAQTILSQLGGYNRLNAMIGLKDVFNLGNGLSFKIKVRGNKGNYVKIIHNSLDLYDVEIGKIHGVNYKVIYSSENHYAEDLKRLIEEKCGIRLSL